MKMTHKPPRDTIDESAESEITIHPDGRIFAFGITAGLAAILATIPTGDTRMKRLLERICRLNAQPSAHEPAPIEETQSCPIPQP